LLLVVASDAVTVAVRNLNAFCDALPTPGGLRNASKALLYLLNNDLNWVRAELISPFLVILFSNTRAGCGDAHGSGVARIYRVLLVL